ncbi:DUF432 domain-containing protein [Hyperthermus butylicus]|uniref:Conserved archaeal protein n=1 Tax=Hyperthermus butylicus (strain DSM 5456 / JCM 9403 / PLM1-5) TaxID=415426 RepID=A2BLH4_HYPBU|nr:DUF432 domain-containing protein [Hyperthermus butylicus]ABM80835.1 conserved archaeal protein [Hyperthermus butylicus DSM 5456]
MLGPGIHSFCGQQLVVEELSRGICRYRRPSGAVQKLVPCEGLHVYPQPPVYYPEHVTSYVMVRFEEPIVVDKGASTNFWVHIDFDVVVVAGSEEDPARVVDAFPSTGRGKYALYGPPNRGLLARYVRAQPLMEPVTEQCRGLARVVIVNQGLQAVEVTRVVFPALHAPVYFDEQGAVYYPEIRVVATSYFSSHSKRFRQAAQPGATEGAAACKTQKHSRRTWGRAYPLPKLRNGSRSITDSRGNSAWWGLVKRVEPVLARAP